MLSSKTATSVTAATHLRAVCKQATSSSRSCHLGSFFTSSIAECDATAARHRPTCAQAHPLKEGASRGRSRVATTQRGSDDRELSFAPTGFVGGGCTPILLTRHDELPAATVTELARLGAEGVVVGGPAAIGEIVMNRLRQEVAGVRYR